MKKAFYYNNKLVRNSEKDYSFAVIREEEEGKIIVWACSTTRPGIEKAYADMRKRLADQPTKMNAYKIVELEAM